VASLEDVVKRVADACAKTDECRAALTLAQDCAEEALHLLTAALDGSTTAEAEGARAELTAASTGFRDLWATWTEVWPQRAKSKNV
jgi:hypothetical protein